MLSPILWESDTYCQISWNPKPPVRIWHQHRDCFIKHVAVYQNSNKSRSNHQVKSNHFCQWKIATWWTRDKSLSWGLGNSREDQGFLRARPEIKWRRSLSKLYQRRNHEQVCRALRDIWQILDREQWGPPRSVWSLRRLDWILGGFNET